ncbi:MAG TPA: cystathionine gamma-synthase family protein [Burkholderiaceae bacterium]|nr:cystathionine gamma-synthase family protein [Burkholderiaceae bacterium]
MTASRKNGLTTTLLHSDRRLGAEHGVLHKPIHPSVAFGYDDARDLAAAFQGTKPGYTYGRSGSPTSAALEAKISLLEQGTGSICFATGMAAIGHTLLSLLRAGDHVVASRFLFGNTTSLFNTMALHGIVFTEVDVTDVANVEAALRPETRVVFLETVANPRTQVADLAGIGELCSLRGILYMVDNTMTTPVLFNPKQVGAGLVMNSLTKYIGGHGNALGGAITDTGLFDWTRFPNIHDVYKSAKPAQWGLTQIRKKGLRDMGGTMAPESAHHIAVGAETLGLRMERICANALALASWLQQQPQVVSVDYPGLASHPQHARATQLFGGRYGGLLSFELAAGIDCFDFLNRLDLVVSSTHLGDNRSLGIAVAHTIYFEMGAEKRAAQGIADSLIRISVGIEDAQDLIADFGQALAR